MEAIGLEQEIAAYQKLLPEIKRNQRSGWALVADSQLVDIFTRFADAARYARSHYGSREVLIRHTDDRASETAPFVHVHSR